MEINQDPNSFFTKTENYSKTSIALLKLKAIDKTSSIFSTVLYMMICFLCFALFFIVFNLGLSILIGELLGMVWLGFFIVGIFYMVAGLLTHFFLRNLIIRLLVDNFLSKDILNS